MDQPNFSVIAAPVIADIISRDYPTICRLVRETYREFGQSRAVNPPSCFMRLKNVRAEEVNRIIALPAGLYGSHRFAGVKWVSSFPENLSISLPRASAVLILNDLDHGHPICCLEGSLISAARTAASAVVGAEVICGSRRAMRTLGIVGNGVIASWIFSFLVEMGWHFDEVLLNDLSTERSSQFAKKISENFTGRVVGSPIDQLFRRSELIILATTASRPHIKEQTLLSNAPRVLNISLRDLDPTLILGSDNVVDDIDHCLREGTSLHLAEQMHGGREFVKANIYECLPEDTKTNWRPSDDRAAIFSPFGMGILDIAVGSYIYGIAAQEGALHKVGEFFPKEGA